MKKILIKSSSFLGTHSSSAEIHTIKSFLHFLRNDFCCQITGMREGPKELASLLVFNGWNYLKLPSFIKKFLHIPMSIIDMFRAVRYSHPDILFCVGGVFYNGLAVVLAGKFFGITSVVRTAEDHCETAKFQKKLIERLAHKWVKLPLSLWVLKNADYVLTVGTESSKYFEKKLERKINYIYSPISDTFINSILKKKSVRMKKTLLYVGGISAVKGTQKVLEIFKEISLRDPEWKMTFVGQNIDIKEFDAFLNSYPNVTFIKSVPNDELVQYYLSHSCLIFSASVGVGYGLVTIEALRCGCPVLVLNPKLDVKYLHEFSADCIDEAVKKLMHSEYIITKIPEDFEANKIELKTREFFNEIK